MKTLVPHFLAIACVLFSVNAAAKGIQGCAADLVERGAGRGRFPSVFWVNGNTPNLQPEMAVSVEVLKSHGLQQIQKVTGLSSGRFSNPRIWFQESFYHPPDRATVANSAIEAVELQAAGNREASIRTSAFYVTVDLDPELFRFYPFQLAYLATLNGDGLVKPIYWNNGAIRTAKGDLRIWKTSIAVGLPRKMSRRRMQALEALLKATERVDATLFNEGFEKREISGNIVLHSYQLPSILEACQKAKSFESNVRFEFLGGEDFPFLFQAGAPIELEVTNAPIRVADIVGMERRLGSQGFVFSEALSMAPPFGWGAPTVTIFPASDRAQFPQLIQSLQEKGMRITAVEMIAAEEPPPRPTFSQTRYAGDSRAMQDISDAFFNTFTLPAHGKRWAVSGYIEPRLREQIEELPGFQSWERFESFVYP